MTEQPDTRRRIMDAAFDVLKEEGITGASARAIAARGDFNQALIFYHFGSVSQLLMETSRTASSQRVATYREASKEVSTLKGLVALARRLHRDSMQEGSVAVLTQLMAGSAGEPEMAEAVLDGFEGWIELVEGALDQVVGGTGLEELVPPRQAAYAISALFLGIELMERLDPSRSEAEAVFDAMDNLAGIFEAVLPMLGPLPPPES